MALGSTLGGIAGGIGGAFIGDPAIGASLGAGLGGMIDSATAKNKANSSMPNFYDPQQQQFLSELNQKRKSLDTGSAYAAGMNAIGATTAGTQNGILSAGGGNVGGTMQALLQSQRLGSNQQNQVLANGEQQNLQYNQMYNELMDKVAGRKLQLQLLDHAQHSSDAAQAEKGAGLNAMAGMGMAGSGENKNALGDMFKKMFGGAGASGDGGSPTGTTIADSGTGSFTGLTGNLSSFAPMMAGI